MTNHIRDVVYISDLEQAMRISLSMLGRQYDYYRSRRERREGAEKERRFVWGWLIMQLFCNFDYMYLLFVASQSTSKLH